MELFWHAMIVLGPMGDGGGLCVAVRSCGLSWASGGVLGGWFPVVVGMGGGRAGSR